MKQIKQIREGYNLITEKEESDTRKLTTLVRAGLFDAKKLPLLKRAMDKDASKLTPAERKVLMELLDSLMSEVLHSQQVYSKVKQNVMNEEILDEQDRLSKFDPRFKEGYPSDKDMPVIIILKRKAIRVYPDNQKVALYYSQALDKYVTIPFGPNKGSLNEAKDDDEEEEQDPRYVTRTKTEISKKGKEKVKEKKVDLYKIQPKKLSQGEYGQLQKAISRDPNLSFTHRLAAKAGAAVGRRLGSGSISGAIGKGIAKGAGAVKKVFTEEDNVKSRFRQRLDEKRELQNEAIPLLAAIPAVAGAVARLAPAAMRAAPTLASKIKDVATSAVTKIKGSGTKAQKPPKTDKGGKKSKADKLDAAADAASIGADIYSATRGGGSSSSDSDTSSAPREYNFQLRAKTNQPRRASTDQVRAERERQTAQKAMMREENIIDSVKHIVKNNINEMSINMHGNKVTINSSIANKINNLYESLNDSNKDRMISMLNESTESFKKIVEFAVRQ